MQNLIHIIYPVGPFHVFLKAALFRKAGKVPELGTRPHYNIIITILRMFILEAECLFLRWRASGSWGGGGRNSREIEKIGWERERE